MEKAKLVEQGGRQLLVLPKSFHFDEDEVYIKTFGKSLVITTKTDARAEFIKGIEGFTDDFVSSFENAGAENEIHA